MRDVRVFNWRAGIIIFIFLIFIAYPFRDLFTVYENLQEKIKVNDRLTLYITRLRRAHCLKTGIIFISLMRKKSGRIHV